MIYFHRVVSLERERNSQLYNRRHEFRKVFCSLEETEIKLNQERKTESETYFHLYTVEPLSKDTSLYNTVEPPIRDPLRWGQRTLLQHHASTLVYYFTSEIGTTSLQGTKLLAPKCPLFGGSTVYRPLTILFMHSFLWPLHIYVLLYLYVNVCVVLAFESRNMSQSDDNGYTVYGYNLHVKKA